MNRVLLLHISEFGGHKKASQNVLQAIQLISPETELLSINGFGYTYPHCEKIVGFLYTTAIKHFPYLWGSIYDKRHIVRASGPLKRIVHSAGLHKFSRLMRDFGPDAVVATQAFPCGLAGDFKLRRNLSFPLVAVVTDYHPNRFWIHPAVDTYCVACTNAQEFLVSQGVSPEKIKVFGIPISHAFRNVLQKGETAMRHGLDPGLPAVLIMGGGSGLGPIKNIVTALDQLSVAFQIIVVCGKNRRLYEWFKNNRVYFKKQIFAFDYVHFIDALMDFSDIIITKAGGITIAEALAKELAIIVVDSIPGQEEKNVTHLKRKGAIREATAACEVPRVVNELLNDSTQMESLKSAARRNAKKESSLEIARFILDLLP